jgi:hypothetical protein
MLQMRSVWWLLLLCGLVAACHPDPDAGVPYPGNPVPGGCSSGTTVALAIPLPGATNVPAQTREIFVASSPGIRLPNIAIALVPLRSASGHQLGPRRLVGPVATPFESPVPPSPFPSPLYYVANGFRLKRNHTYFVDVAVLGSSCKPTKIPVATFRTAPY